jgi:hypothetical protein
MRAVDRRELRVRPQRLASGGIEPPEESSNGLRYRELQLPTSRLSGSESAEGSLISNRTGPYETFG